MKENLDSIVNVVDICTFTELDVTYEKENVK